LAPSSVEPSRREEDLAASDAGCSNAAFFTSSG
jgi:hypothetical protein